MISVDFLRPDVVVRVIWFPNVLTSTCEGDKPKNAPKSQINPPMPTTLKTMITIDIPRTDQNFFLSLRMLSSTSANVLPGFSFISADGCVVEVTSVIAFSKLDLRH